MNKMFYDNFRGDRRSFIHLNSLYIRGEIWRLSLAINPLNASVALMICFANQLTGFYMRATLAFNGLNKKEHNFLHTLEV